MRTIGIFLYMWINEILHFEIWLFYWYVFMVCRLVGLFYWCEVQLSGQLRLWWGDKLKLVDWFSLTEGKIYLWKWSKKRFDQEECSVFLLDLVEAERSAGGLAVEENVWRWVEEGEGFVLSFWIWCARTAWSSFFIHLLLYMHYAAEQSLQMFFMKTGLLGSL